VLTDSQPSAGGRGLFAPGRSAKAHLVAPVSDNTYVAVEYAQPLSNTGEALWNRALGLCGRLLC
jgi:hypothetical protein